MNKYAPIVVFFCSILAAPASFAVTLDELTIKALASYPTVLSGLSSRDAAETDLLAAKLKFLPNPSVSTQRQSISYSGQPSAREPATNVTITQPLFLDGGIIAGYKKADAKLSAADYALLETREDVIKRVINAYAEWFKAWFKIQALEESVSLHAKFVGTIVRRYDQGLASGSDKDLGNSRLFQAKADLDSQLSIESTALSSLSELAGEQIRRGDLMTSVAQPVSVPKRIDGIAQASAISVSVHRYKFEAEAAEQEAKEIRAQALPQVSLQAQRQIGNAYVPGAQGYDMYGLVVSYTPNGGFSSIAGAGAAFERAKAATFRIDLAKRELNDRLNAEYNEYEFSLLKRESLKRSVHLSSDIASSYDRQYLVGRKSWLDLMNSVREQTQIRVQLADAEGVLLASSRRLMVYVAGSIPFDDPNAKLVSGK